MSSIVPAATPVAASANSTSMVGPALGPKSLPTAGSSVNAVPSHPAAASPGSSVGVVWADAGPGPATTMSSVRMRSTARLLAADRAVGRTTWVPLGSGPRRCRPYSHPETTSPRTRALRVLGRTGARAGFARAPPRRPRRWMEPLATCRYPDSSPGTSPGSLAGRRVRGRPTVAGQRRNPTGLPLLMVFGVRLSAATVAGDHEATQPDLPRVSKGASGSTSSGQLPLGDTRPHSLAVDGRSPAPRSEVRPAP